MSNVKMVASCSLRLALSPMFLDDLGLHATYTSEKDTPAKTTHLPKNAKGKPANPHIKDPSVVGMPFHLAWYTQPESAFAGP